MDRSFISHIRRAVLALFFTFALMLAGLTGAVPDDGAGLSCYKSWSEAGPVLREEKLIPPADLRATLEDDLDARMLRVHLCQKDGQWLYRVVMLQADGSVITVFRDARSLAKVSASN